MMAVERDSARNIKVTVMQLADLRLCLAKGPHATLKDPSNHGLYNTITSHITDFVDGPQKLYVEYDDANSQVYLETITGNSGKAILHFTFSSPETNLSKFVRDYLIYLHTHVRPSLRTMLNRDQALKMETDLFLYKDEKSPVDLDDLPEEFESTLPLSEYSSSASSLTPSSARSLTESAEMSPP